MMYVGAGEQKKRRRRGDQTERSYVRRRRLKVRQLHSWISLDLNFELEVEYFTSLLIFLCYPPDVVVASL